MAHRTYDICVLGAYGSYGALCCELLLRLEWSSGPLRVALAGRNIGKLRALQQSLTKAAEPSSASLPRLELLVHPEPVDANSYDDVMRLVQQARVLISFVRTSSADTVGTLVSACIAARCDYVDICALPSVLKYVAERYNAAASAACCFILPGAGFDYAITDVAAQRALHLYRAMYKEAPATLEKVLAISPGPSGIVIKRHILADALEAVPAAAAASPAARDQGCSARTHSNDCGAAAAAGGGPPSAASVDKGEAPWAAAGQQQEVLARMGANRCAPSLSAISTCASSSWRSLSSLSAAAGAADDGGDAQDMPPQTSQAAAAAVEPNFRAALAPLVAKGALSRGAASTPGSTTSTLSTLVLGLVKPGQLLSHLLRYSPVLKRYSIPFPLGGEAEQFLLQRYQQLMVPGRTAAGGSVDGEDEGLLGVEGLELSRAPAATAAGPAAAGAPELDTRLALPGLSLATWSAGRLLWALYYLTLVVWAALGFLLARALPPLRPLYMRLLTAASKGHVTADVAAADTAMSQFTFKLLMVMGGCKVRPAPVQRSLTGVTTSSRGSALKSAGPQDSSSSSDGSNHSRRGLAPSGEETAEETDGPHMSDSSRDAVRSRHDQVAALHYPAAKAAGAHEEGHGLLHSSSKAAAVAAAGVQDDIEGGSEPLPVLKVVCSGPTLGKWSQLTSLCAALAAQRLLLLSHQQGEEALPPAGVDAGGEADGGRSMTGAAQDVASRRDQAAWEDVIGAPDAAAVVTTSGFTNTHSSSSGGGGSGTARRHTMLEDTGKDPAVGGAAGGSGSAVDHQLEEKPWVHPVAGNKQSRGQLALLPPYVDFSVTSMGSEEHQLLSAEYTEELGGAGVSGCGRRVPYGVVTPAVLLAGDPWFMCELHRLADVQLCVRL